MKIFLPFTIRGIGGTATFAKKFQTGMNRAGHEVFLNRPDRYDILLLIVQAPFHYLWDAKKRGRKIIQRLDGTYYWTVASWKFPLFNLKAAIIRHFFADFTVYQSNYSKYSADTFLGRKDQELSALIYNGVDTELFSPIGTKQDLRDTPGQHIFFTASAFRREDQIVPLFEALSLYREKYQSSFKFLIAGSFTGKASHIPERYRHFKEAVFLGKIENADLPAYERAADVFLFSHLNPPCPNNVIEALACGLPVCGMADGAMPEIITPGLDGELAPIEGNGFWKKRNYEPRIFAENLKKITDNQKTYAEAARATAERRFSLETMIKEYTSIINTLITPNS